MDSKADKFSFYNSLVGLVKALETHYTVVDLRNENTVAGKIVSVDGCMNIDMEDVIFLDSKGREHVFKNFFINNRNIRYVHIPKNLSSKELIETQINSMARPKPTKKPHTLKISRAKKRQIETVISAYQQEPSPEL